MVEPDTERLRETYMKRILLEQESGDDLAALETGREASSRFAESKEVQITYLKTIYQCESVKKEERKQEVLDLLQKYPFLKETEAYTQLEEAFRLMEDTKEESVEKGAQENTTQGNEGQEDITPENGEEGETSQGETPQTENTADAEENPAA